VSRVAKAERGTSLDIYIALSRVHVGRYQDPQQTEGHSLGDITESVLHHQSGIEALYNGICAFMTHIR
jgi:hypothetical protein